LSLSAIVTNSDKACRGDEIVAARAWAQAFGNVSGERGYRFGPHELGEKSEFARLVDNLRTGASSRFCGAWFELNLHRRRPVASGRIAE
jgi:hypothetical protein